MATVVENSTDQVEAALNGGKFPVPVDVAADNAAREAKKDGKEPPKAEAKVENPDPVKEAAKAADELDDTEGEDGLTPRQKREFTKSMLATIAKKHRAQREAEELATNEYNRGRLAEQRNEQLLRENARLQEQLKPAAAEVKDKSPVRTDFETDQAYQDALIDYRVDQKLKIQRAEETKRADERKQQEIVQHAGAMIERAIELVPDFKAITEAVDMPVPPHIASFMQESDLFAEIGYHFASDPKVLEKLSEYTEGLTPGTREFVKGATRSLVELGKIVGTLQPFAAIAKAAEDAETRQQKSPNGTEPSTETGSAPSKPRVQAPIIRPLNAGSAAQVERDEANMTGSQVITSWQKKHGVTLTARKRH